jgi:hypothetical protein
MNTGLLHGNLTGMKTGMIIVQKAIMVSGEIIIMVMIITRGTITISDSRGIITMNNRTGEMKTIIAGLRDQMITMETGSRNGETMTSHNGNHNSNLTGDRSNPASLNVVMIITQTVKQM